MSVWGSNSLEHLKNCSKEIDSKPNSAPIVKKEKIKVDDHVYTIEEITNIVERRRDYIDAQYNNDYYYCYYLIFKEYLNKQPLLNKNDDLYDYSIEMFKLWEDYFLINYWNDEYSEGILIFEDLLKKKYSTFTIKNVNENILKILITMEQYSH